MASFAEMPAFVMMSAPQISRRNALRAGGLALASICLSHAPGPAYALKPGKPSKEKLLADLREEKTPEEIEEEKARVAAERKARLERQRELQAAADRRKAGLEDPVDNTEIESNLRGQYYFPTARKRYLPRVKLAWDTIPNAEEAARSSKWPMVSEILSAELSDAVLPMKLYASALAGGGLSITGKFIEKMNAQTQLYEQALKKLGKATKRRETAVALDSLSSMRGAIDAYRKLGHLEAPDFGIGEIPSSGRVGSGFGNNNSALYLRNKSVQEVSHH